MHLSFIGKHSYRFDFRSCLISTSVFLLMPFSFANAAGDAAQGQRDYDYTCRHCHGSPQPGKPGAFSDFDVTANRLSVYASDPSAITKAANEGYVIPDGNSNNDYPPGAKTTEAMNSFAGTGSRRFGEGTKPTTYAINISAYFASLFSAPNTPTIGTAKIENGEALVSFTAPKSDLTITGYTVTANPGEITATGSASPITVKGLTIGTAYTFTVTATSNAGTSKPSSASNSVTPAAATATAAVPVKAAPAVAAVSQVVPVIPVAQAKAVVPVVPVVAPVIAPVVQAKIITPVIPVSVPQTKAAAPSTPVVQVPQVKAVVPASSVNASGTANPIKPIPASSLVVPAVPVVQAKTVAPVAAVITPSVPSTPAVEIKAAPPVSSVAQVSAAAKATPVATVESIPSAVVAASAVTHVQVPAPSHSVAKKIVLQTPTMKMARAGGASARVFFGAPADSATITSYTVTALTGGAATGITASGPKSPITISGLANGTVYTFTVTANSSAGTSEASEQSNSVTPLKILGD